MTLCLALAAPSSPVQAPHQPFQVVESTGQSCDIVSLRRCRRHVRRASRGLPLRRMVQLQRARRGGDTQQDPRRRSLASLATVPRGLRRALRRGAVSCGARREGGVGGRRGPRCGRGPPQIAATALSGLERARFQPREVPPLQQEDTQAAAPRPPCVPAPLLEKAGLAAGRTLTLCKQP
jgi:hypothetical protein